MANGTLKVSNIETSSGSGTITIGQSGETITVPSGATISGSIANTPAFEAFQSVAQTPSLSTYVKLTMTSESFDTDSAYDATNSKFTVPSGKAGKYLFLLSAGGYDNDTGLDIFRLVIYKNGAQVRFDNILDTDQSSIQTSFGTCVGILNLAASDYIEAYIYASSNGGTYTTLHESSGLLQTRFAGYRLIG